MNPLFIGGGIAAAAYFLLKPKSASAASFSDAIENRTPSSAIKDPLIGGLKITEEQIRQSASSPNYSPVYRNAGKTPVAAIPFKRPTQFKTTEWLKAFPKNSAPNELQYKINECAKALISSRNAFRNQGALLSEVVFAEADLDAALTVAKITANKSEVFICLANCTSSLDGQTLHSPRKVIINLANGGKAESYKVDWYDFTVVATAENYANLASSLPNVECRHNNLDIPAPYGVGMANIKSPWIKSNRQQGVRDGVFAIMAKGEEAAGISEDKTAMVIAWNTDQGNVLVRYDATNVDTSGVLKPLIQKRI